MGRRDGLGVDDAGEVGAHVDEVVQDVAVELGVCGLLASGVFEVGRGWLGGHERKKNILGFGVSRLAWVGWGGCGGGAGWGVRRCCWRGVVGRHDLMRHADGGWRCGGWRLGSGLGSGGGGVGCMGQLSGDRATFDGGRGGCVVGSA